MRVFGWWFCDLGTQCKCRATRTGAQLSCPLQTLLPVLSCSFCVELLHLSPTRPAWRAASVCAGPPLGCCCWLQAVTGCLVTSPCIVTGVLLTVWVQAGAVRAGSGPGAGSVCSQSPAGGQDSSAWSLFLHLPRILAQLGPNFDEVAFCSCGCLFFQATCRHVGQCLDLDLWMFLFH